jgi:hypothetical protein
MGCYRTCGAKESRQADLRYTPGDLRLKSRAQPTVGLSFREVLQIIALEPTPRRDSAHRERRGHPQARRVVGRHFFWPGQRKYHL